MQISTPLPTPRKFDEELMIVLSLFDLTGIMIEPWAAAGYECICIDNQHAASGRREGNIHFINMDLGYRAESWKILAAEFAGIKTFIFGFPPCTDMASSGSQWWAGKRELNENFQEEAAALAIYVEDLARTLKCAFMVENPGGILTKLWRPADYIFDPCDYGGYLSKEEPHPTYPDIIPPQDAYEKTTNIWCNSKFNMPEKRRVPPVFRLYRKGNGKILKVSPIVAQTGGSSIRTKNIRSATPRGFARAVFYANGVHS